MYAVIFEVVIKDEYQARYLELAASLREEAANIPGFISVERFSSVVNEGKMVSLSYWGTEEAISQWRSNLNHQAAQQKGITEYFEDFTIRVAKVEREYSLADRIN